MRKPTTQNEKGDARTDSANVVFFARDDDDDDAFPILFVRGCGGSFLVQTTKTFGGDVCFVLVVSKKRTRTLKNENK